MYKDFNIILKKYINLRKLMCFNLMLCSIFGFLAIVTLSSLLIRLACGFGFLFFICMISHCALLDFSDKYRKNIEKL